MAQIPSEQNYIFEESVRSDAAVSESAFQILGGSINFLLDNQAALDGKTWKVVEYISNAVFTVPEDVSTIYVEGCGGGGGSGIFYENPAGTTNTQYHYYQGGFGAALVQRVLAVTPLSSHNVIIGSGGGGLSTSLAPLASIGRVSGGDTTLGSIFTARGGLGGGSKLGFSQRFSIDTGVGIFPSPSFLYDFTHKRTVGEAAGAVSGNTSGLMQAEGSITGFLSQTSGGIGSGAPIGSGLSGGSGPFGGGIIGTASPNTGAGGGIQRTGNNIVTGYAGGSGRLRIAYVSKF